MKAFCSTMMLLFVLAACSERKVEPASSAPAPAQQPPAAADTGAATPPASSASAGDAVDGTWGGQLKIDAHAGAATLNYVGSESGDFVPMRFRTDSEVGTKILAACGDEDLCEIEGAVRFLDEPPPDNASAVGEIVRVDRVKRLPPDAR